MRAKMVVDGRDEEEMDEFWEGTFREVPETVFKAIPRTSGGAWSHLRAETNVYAHDDKEMDELREPNILSTRPFVWLQPWGGPCQTY